MSSAPQLRRTDRLMSDIETEETLVQGYCGRLGTVGADGWPYVVPLLYVWMDGQIYTHNTAARGHLRQNVEQNAKVCFEVDIPGEVFPYGRFECDTSISYRSVIAFGEARIVEVREEKARFCEELMHKYASHVEGRPEGVFPRLDQITVYALTIERMTGKRNLLPEPSRQWPSLDQTRTPNAATDR